MLFLILDDGVSMFESPEAAAQAVEGIDIIDELRVAFDEHGRKYQIEWIERPRRRWFSVTIGEYRLVPDVQMIDRRAALELLEKYDGPEAASAREALRAMKS